MGIPTVGGEVEFNSSYNDNILVNAMCVGIAKKIKSSTQRHQELVIQLFMLDQKQVETEFMEQQWLQQNLMKTLKKRDQQFR